MHRNKVCVGVITGSFGVRGEARVKSFCSDPSSIADYSPLSNEDGKSFSITITRPVKGGFGVRLGGVSSKEQAEAMKGMKLYANRDDLPALPDDEYYYSDLIGLQVLDTGGEKVGRVTAVHDHGAGAMLEIAGPKIKDSALLLFSRENVPTIDLGEKRIVIDAPEGTF